MVAKIKDLLENTEATVISIADQVGVGWKVVWNILHKNYDKEFIQKRKRRSYSLSKLGDKNPCYGKKPHNWKELKEDGKGYMLSCKPSWYTGRVGSSHVFTHSLVMCEALGLTEIPKGFCVHHIDHNPKNNSIHNLCLVSVNGHSRMHPIKRRRNDYPKGVGGKSPRSANIKSDNASA